MKRKYKWMTVVLSLALTASITACGSNEQAAPTEAPATADATETADDSAVEEAAIETEAETEEAADGSSDDSLTISSDELIMFSGRSNSLDVYNAAGDVTWNSSDPDSIDITTFEDDTTFAMVNAKKPVDAVTITATDGVSTVTSTVKALSAGLCLRDDRGNDGAYSSGTYRLGTRHTYSAYIDNDPVDTSELTWNSYDENVVTVDNGVVTMAGEGVTYISATDKSGNTAFAFLWVSDTDDEWEYETKTPGYGLFFEYTFSGYEEHILSGVDNESISFYLGEVYDDGDPVDASTLTWKVEDFNGHVFDIYENETNDEGVSVIFTQEQGQTFLVATTPATGHEYRYMIMAYKA